MQSGRLHFHPKREKTWGQHKNRDLQVREQACCLLSEKLKVYKNSRKKSCQLRWLPSTVSCDGTTFVWNFRLIKTKSQKKWQTSTSGFHHTAPPAHSVLHICAICQMVVRRRLHISMVWKSKTTIGHLLPWNLENQTLLVTSKSSLMSAFRSDCQEVKGKQQ